MIRSNMISSDDKFISVVEWNDVSDPIGILQISHGMAEHAMRYDMFAKKMNEAGIIVVADDHRGHGETDKDTHGYSRGNMWEETLSDMGNLLTKSKAKYSKIYGKELKTVIFGHSYGSFLTQEFIKRHRDELQGAVIGGSNYFAGAVVHVGKLAAKIGISLRGDDHPNKFLEKMSFDAYNRRFKEGTFISSVLEECERYNNDKDCGFTCSSNFYYHFFKGSLKLYKHQGNNLMGFPILLVSGENDPVGNMGKGVKKLEKWYKTKNADVRCKLYSGVRHEYLNDISREETTEDIKNFCIKMFTKDE